MESLLNTLWKTFLEFGLSKWAATWLKFVEPTEYESAFELGYRWSTPLWKGDAAGKVSGTDNVNFTWSKFDGWFNQTGMPDRYKAAAKNGMQRAYYDHYCGI